MIDRIYAPPLRRDRAFATVDPHAGDPRRGPMLLGVAVSVLLALIGVIWSTYHQGVREGGRDAPPRIAALREPYKVAPEDPGGVATEHLGVRVFDVLEDRRHEPASESYDPALVEPELAENDHPPEAIAEWEVVEPHGAGAGEPEAPAPAPRLKPPVPEPEVEGGRVLGPRTLADAADPSRRYFALREPITPAEPDAGAAEAAQAARPSPAEVAAEASPEPAPPAAPAVPPPVENAIGSFHVQLASFRSSTAAQAGWDQFRDAFEDLLPGYAPDVARADLGDRGVHYRLRVGVFTNRAAASSFCDEVKARGRECLVVGS
jgi:cell division septation protein DedD